MTNKNIAQAQRTSQDRANEQTPNEEPNDRLTAKKNNPNQPFLFSNFEF